MTTEADAAAGGGPPQASPTTKEGKMSEKQQRKMTKRQKRKQVNETNKWPQHPKIQDMEVRSKAYIRVAGLGSSTKKKESVDPKLDLMSPEVKFGRLLGSTDQRKRHVAVQKLKAYLKARCDIHNENGGVSEMDLLKLWKGLWYTLYMADKTPVQDELSKHLAELLWCVAGTEEEDEYAGQAYMEMCEEEEQDNAKEDEDQDDEDSDDPDVTLEEIVNTLHEDNDEDEEEDDDDDDEEEEEEDDDDSESDAEGKEMEQEDDNDEEEEAQEGHELYEDELDDSEVPHCRGAHLASLFIRTFFRTVKREWGNMDKYRVDKFYTLARLYMHEIFKYMAMRHWNLGIIRLFNDAIFEEVLNERPNGLRYHMIDIALDELAKVNAKAPMQLTEATFLDTLEPYFAMSQTGAGGDDTVQTRVVENVLEKFLNKYSVVGDIATSEDDDDEEAKELVFDQVHVGTVAHFIFELASDAETKDHYRKSLYEMHKSYMRRLKKGQDIPLNEEEEESENVGMEAEDLNENDASCGGGLLCRHATPCESAESVEEEEPSEAEEIQTPPLSKKEKKRRKRKEIEEDDEGDKNKEEFETPPPKKNKKSKKKKDQKESNTSVESVEKEEEVVTISLGDQKKAKAEGKKKKKVLEEEPKKVSMPSSAERRRVQWLPNNKSKSYKASIKGLLTASLPRTSEVTPEKSILLNKGKVRRAGVTKAGRKKAVNYF